MMWMYLKSVIDSEVSQKEKNKYHGNIYMKPRKMVLMNLFAGQEQRCGYREETWGYSGRRRGWDELKEYY